MTNLMFWAAVAVHLAADVPRSEVGEEAPPPANVEAKEKLGSLPKQVIYDTIMADIKGIRRCYERALVQHSGLAGTVSVKFEIAPSGTVAKAWVKASDLGQAEAEQCVVERIRALEFPEPDGDGKVTVTFPFAFAPAQTPDSTNTGQKRARTPPSEQ